MEQKGKNLLSQWRDVDKGFKEADSDRDNMERDKDYLAHNKNYEEQGYWKGMIGNLGLMKRDISTIQEHMQDIRREFDQLRKTTRGERTLGQHIDRLSEVIGNA